MEGLEDLRKMAGTASIGEVFGNYLRKEAMDKLKISPSLHSRTSFLEMW